MSGRLLLPPPRTPQGTNPFAVLGVSPYAALQEVKRAYLCLARKYHPIMSRRDLTDLMLKCQVVKAKAEYAEGLQLFKRAKLDPQVAGGAATGELGKQLQVLGMYPFFVCPSCKWGEKCNHATRFDEVEEIHRELMSKAMTAFWGGKDEQKRTNRTHKRGKRGS